MSARKELGKIKKCHVGYCGYQEAQFGVSFELGGESWGVGSSMGPWAKWYEGCKWTLDDQSKQWGETMAYLRDLCSSAKVQSADELVGIPVEVTFDGNTLKAWRILSEVL